MHGVIAAIVVMHFNSCLSRLNLHGSALDFCCACMRMFMGSLELGSRSNCFQRMKSGRFIARN